MQPACSCPGKTTRAFSFQKNNFLLVLKTRHGLPLPFAEWFCIQRWLHNCELQANHPGQYCNQRQKTCLQEVLKIALTNLFVAMPTHWWQSDRIRRTPLGWVKWRPSSTIQWGGSKETELKELAVTPTKRDWALPEVTTVTPVPKLPKALRNSRLSHVMLFLVFIERLYGLGESQLVRSLHTNLCYRGPYQDHEQH